MFTIDQIENTFHCKLHTSVQELVSTILVSQKPIHFNVPGFWGFTTLDFNSEYAFEKDFSQINYPDTYHLPALASAKIESFLRNYAPIVEYESIFPFARNNWGDKTMYLFFESNSASPVLVDIDNGKVKPVVFDLTISELIPIEGLTESDSHWTFEYNSAFEDLVKPEMYFVSIPDGIWSSDSYKELFESALNLIGQPYQWTFTSLSEDADSYTIQIQFNNRQHLFHLQKSSHYVDSISFVNALNRILSESSLRNDSQYSELSYDHFDFAILLSDKKLLHQLKRGGHIKYKPIEYTQAELALIEKESDRRRQLEGLLFMITVTIPELEKEFKGQVVPLAMEIESVLTEKDLAFLLKDRRIKKIELEEGDYYFYIQV